MGVRIECNLEAYDKTYDCYHFRLAIAFSAAVARFIRRPSDAVSIIYHRARLNHSPPTESTTGNEKRPFISASGTYSGSYRTARIISIRVLINGCLNYVEAGEGVNSRDSMQTRPGFLRVVREAGRPLFPRLCGQRHEGKFLFGEEKSSPREGRNCEEWTIRVK